MAPAFCVRPFIKTPKEGIQCPKFYTYACCRNAIFDEDTENKLVGICNAIVPDNVISPSQHKMLARQDIAYAITMCSSTPLLESNLSLLLGVLFEKQDSSWSKPKSYYPDGNYALFRNDQNEIEVVSDAAASRTIWYFHDETLFLASTSQRAIILFLGEFQFDERVIPWMLSTGSLGPQLSWDKRLKRLPPDSSVLLDKKTGSTRKRVGRIP